MMIRPLTLVLSLSMFVACSKDTDFDDDFDDTGSVSDAEASDEETVPAYCAVAGSISPSGDGWLVEGDQYALYAETTEAEALVMSAMLEAAGEALEVWFGAAPDGAGDALMVAELYSSESRWEDAIRADGVDVPTGAGGYYHPTTQTAYLYQQPTVYYTRQLLLHEVIHQFHDLAKTLGRSLPGWNAEGHAEYLSLYDWDGECLRLGRLPLVTVDDQPAKALAQSDSLNLDSHMASDGSVSRPLEWAMFRFFEHADNGVHAEQWFAFLDYMDAGGTDAVAEFSAIFGRSPGSFDAEIARWIATEQQPMEAVYGDWLHIDAQTAQGQEDYFGFARLKQGAESFSMRFDPVGDGPWAAGVLLSFDDAENYTALLVESNGLLTSFESDEGSLVYWDQGTAPAAIGGGFDINVVHEGGSSTISINDASMSMPLRFAPTGGLAVNGSHIRFSDIAWR